MRSTVIRFKRHIWATVIALVVQCILPQLVLAAGELTVVLAQQAGKTGPRITRNFVADWIIVVVLVAFALFAICKPSHRR